MNRSSIIVFAVVLGLACGPGPESGFDETDETATASSSLTQVSSFGSNPGNLSMYMYVPTSLPSSNVPVVVAMHGCAMSASSYQNAGWNKLADQLGFIVVYPQTSASAGCFGWYNSSDITRGSGQVLSLKQMVDYTKTNYHGGKAYVTGLSAGGAMAVAALAAYPDVFSAGAIMAGIPYACGISCMSSASNKTPTAWGDLVRNAAPAQAEYPRVAVWHGASDTTVVPANGDETVTQWTNVNGITDTPTSTETVGSATVKRYADSSGRVRVEYWKVAGMNHGTAVDPANGCGQASSYILNVKLCSSAYAAEFFGLTEKTDGGTTDAGQPDAGPKDAGQPDAGQPDAGPKDAGQPDAGQPDAGQPDAGQPDAGPKDAGQPDAGQPDAGPKDAGQPDAGQPDAGPKDAGVACVETYSSNYAHTTAGRAALCKPYNGRVCTIGANNDLGLWSIGVSSWVRSPRAGYYEAGRCQ